jgi:NCAIR mutase (PurE)-related protein
MTDYVKQHATAEAFEKLETLIAQDSRFRGMLDKLWEKAFQSGFSKESTDRIKSAYLSKAKTLLPSVIKSARNKALKDRETTVDTKPQARKGPIARGHSTTPSSGRIRKASDIPAGMTTLDVLMKD